MAFFMKNLNESSVDWLHDPRNTMQFSRRSKKKIISCRLFKCIPTNSVVVPNAQFPFDGFTTLTSRPWPKAKMGLAEGQKLLGRRPKRSTGARSKPA